MAAFSEGANSAQGVFWALSKPAHMLTINTTRHHALYKASGAPEHFSEVAPSKPARATLTSSAIMLQQGHHGMLTVSRPFVST